MAARVRSFHAAGGRIVAKDGLDAELQSWAEEVYDYYHVDFLAEPAEERATELDWGLTLLWGALTEPPCLVAVADGHAMAALAYRVRQDALQPQALGSRQVVEGAGTAVEVALAGKALEMDLGVLGQYRAAARGFHLGIGRRLDEGPGERTSRWTLEDCRTIVEGVAEAL